MSPELELVLIGAVIGFLGSIMSAIFVYWLEGRRLKRQWGREDKLRHEQWERERLLREKEIQLQERERIGNFLQNQRIEELGKTTIKPSRWYCFLPGTKVTLGDRSSDFIENISEGCLLLSYDTATKKFTVGECIEVIKGEANEYIKINKNIHVTPSHLFYVNNQWVQAKSIQIGDVMFSENDLDIYVSSLEYVNSNTFVYNLNLASNYTFFANGVLVHGLNEKEKAAREKYKGSGERPEQQMTLVKSLDELKQRLAGKEHESM